MSPAPSGPRPADAALVLRAQDGDVSAFERLVDRHQAGLFRVAYMVLGNRQDAEDVVQESFLTAWRRLHLLEQPAAFRSWVSRICTQRSMDAVRKQARRGTNPADLTADAGVAVAGDPVGAGAPTGDPARSAEVNAQLRALADILGTLSPELRACWVLREVDGMSYAEIGQVLQLTEPTVRGRLSRARSHIIESMEGWR